MKGIRLKGIRLGIPAAERDISRDAARNVDFHRGLMDYFVESDIYRSVERGETRILIGNRGSGKSAIFQVSAARERKAGNIVVEITPDEYSYEIFNETLKTEMEGSWAKQGAYAVAWKYVLYVTVMKEISDRSTNVRTKALKRIKDYLRDNYKGAQVGILDNLLSYMKRVEGVKLGEYSISLKTQELRQLYQLDEIQNLLGDLATFCESREVLVFVDELDRGWDASDNARQFVAGLFRAAISVNSLTPNLRVLITLRRELYDNIPEIYEDAQKVRDLVRYVEWDAAGLRELIQKRIKAAFPTYREMVGWNSLFPTAIGESAQDSFSYFVDRTLWRPRELIQFCNQCLEQVPSDAEDIDENAIRVAEGIYSRDRAQDIAAEYRFQFPGLGEIFETFRGKPRVMSREDLEFYCLQIVEDEMLCPKARSWLNLKNHEELIHILWQIGFLRALVGGPETHKTLTSGRFLGPHQIATVNLNNVSQFMIHEMFWSYYGLQ